MVKEISEMKRFMSICGNVFTRRFSIFAYILMIFELMMYAMGKTSLTNFLSTLVITIFYNFVIIFMVVFSERRGR